jgi:hypothetical protein
MTIPQFIFVAAGALTIFMGLTNIGVKSRKMQRLVRLIGEMPARLIYVVFGIALIVVAFVVDLGTI